MLVLGIETSCDETGVAIYETGRGLLGHRLHSQIDLHAAYGGVVPELASRDHIRRLPLLRHHPEWIGSAESYFQRYGIASLLVGRFIGPLRPMLPMVAGMFDMPLPRFIAVSLLAGAGWSVAYLLPGWATGAAMVWRTRSLKPLLS